MKGISAVIVCLAVFLSAGLVQAEEKFDYGEKGEEAGVGEKMNFIDG